MNRVSGEQDLFADDGDYEVFERVPTEGRERKLDKGEALLDDWPVDRPRGWRRVVNEPQSEKELDRLHTCLRRGHPYGDEAWTRRTAVKLGLESSLRPVGRPRKVPERAI